MSETRPDEWDSDDGMASEEAQVSSSCHRYDPFCRQCQVRLPLQRETIRETRNRNFSSLCFHHHGLSFHQMSRNIYREGCKGRRYRNDRRDLPLRCHDCPPPPPTQVLFPPLLSVRPNPPFTPPLPAFEPQLNAITPHLTSELSSPPPLTPNERPCSPLHTPPSPFMQC